MVALCREHGVEEVAIDGAHGAPTGQHFFDPKFPEGIHIFLDLQTGVNGAVPHQSLGPYRIHHRLEIRLVKASLFAQRPHHNAFSPAIHHHLSLFHGPRSL